jgi:MOSC domain-containing protein YiiM
MTGTIRVAHLFVSPGHNFVGHHGQPPGTHEIVEVPQVECLAGRGLRGDRFFDHQENHKGQVTFFAMEVYEALRRELGVTGASPAAFRRNVITLGADLPKLVGRRFAVQGIEFEGVEECRPCYWMNLAFHPQAEAKLQGRGGLRARILTTGVLRADNPAEAQAPAFARPSSTSSRGRP